MAWLAVHPANTMRERVPDEEGAPTFELGFWPPRTAEQINALMARVRADKRFATLDPVKDNQELRDGTDFRYELLVEAVRYGVRGWSGFAAGAEEIPPLLEAVKIDGLEYSRLSEASIQVLHANGLVIPLAQACQLFNGLSEAQKKTSGLRWPSATSPSGTAASGATQSGGGSPLAGSSASTTAPSATAAPST